MEPSEAEQAQVGKVRQRVPSRGMQEREKENEDKE